MFKEIILPALLIVAVVAAIFVAGTTTGVYVSQGYTRAEIDTGLTNVMRPFVVNMDSVVRKVFPEAVKYSEANGNCPMDLKTMKCQVGQEKK